MTVLKLHTGVWVHFQLDHAVFRIHNAMTLEMALIP